MSEVPRKPCGCLANAFHSEATCGLGEAEAKRLNDLNEAALKQQQLPPEEHPMTDPAVDLTTIKEMTDESVTAAFKEKWEDPKFTTTVNGTFCERCGSSVLRTGVHMIWHKNVAFAIFILQSFVVDHIEGHKELAKAMDNVVTAIEEMEA